MKLINNNISIYFPECLILNCKSNENETEGDIDLMARKIAEEVKFYINT
jgi:hypothetical protein